MLQLSFQSNNSFHISIHDQRKKLYDLIKIVLQENFDNMYILMSNHTKRRNKNVCQHTFRNITTFKEHAVNYLTECCTLIMQRFSSGNSKTFFSYMKNIKFRLYLLKNKCSS